MITLRRSYDVEAIAAIYRELWPSDAWPGNNEAWWLLRDGDEVVGFCSARQIQGEKTVFLSSAGIRKGVRGAGIQKRMIHTRIKWARSVGATHVITYTLWKNYPSLINLLRTGFRFYEPDYAWCGRKVHYYIKKII